MMRRLMAAAVMVGLAGAAWAAADGKALYGAKCASCHGKDAKGNPAMAKMFNVAPAALDLSGGWTADSEKSRAEVFEKGKGKMPAYGDKLPAEERAAVIAYLKGGSGTPTAGGQAVAPATPKVQAAAGDGAGVYAKTCVSCHGKDGKGNAAMAKMFKVEPAALDMTSASTTGKTAAELAGVIRDGRGKMPAYKAKLSDGEISSVAAYLKGGMKAAASESERP